jgi:broad specificity phosphatase PhoE
MRTDSLPGGSRLILVRHGESEGNRDRTFTQHADVPLTALGREQARAAADRIGRLFRPARLVSSPFARARETAAIIAASLGVPVELEPALQEQSFGVFAGQPYTALLSDAAYHEGPRWHWRPEGGESLTDVSARVVPAFERIARARAGQDTVVVSHGGVMLAVCAYATGSWDGLSVAPNGGILVVEWRNGRCSTPVSIETA